MDWIALILSVVAVWLNARKQIACWFLYLLSNIAWAFFAFSTKQPALFAMQGIFFALNIYAWFKWRPRSKHVEPMNGNVYVNGHIVSKPNPPHEGH